MQSPLLKIGIVSDSQGNGYDDVWGFSNLDCVMRRLTHEKVDVLVYEGDIAVLPEESNALLRLHEPKRAKAVVVKSACYIDGETFPGVK